APVRRRRTRTWRDFYDQTSWTGRGGGAAVVLCRLDLLHCNGGAGPDLPGLSRPGECGHSDLHAAHHCHDAGGFCIQCHSAGLQPEAGSSGQHG
ncbi:DUF6429 domain-containing protein, partial [Dysosmobacter welbionis]